MQRVAISRRVVAAIAFAWFAAPAGAQTIWDAADKPHDNVGELRCRGGAGLEFKSLGFKQFPSGNTRVAVALKFAPNPNPAGSQSEGLEAGSCGWVGRVLAATEPREVHFITPAYYQSWPGPLDTSARAAERFTDVQSMALYLKYPDHYWTFRAFDTGNGHFDTTTHGYWTDFSARAAQRGHYEEDQLPPDTSRWRVRASIGGGIDGRSGQITLDADGDLQASASWGNVHCSAKVGARAVQSIEAAIARSRPETWKKSYAPKDNPHGCCDLIGLSLRLEREDAQQRRSASETEWFAPTVTTALPESIAALHDAVWETRKVCAFPQ